MIAASRVGLGSLTFAPDATISAPQSGVTVGMRADGPVSLRLFRSAGTRLVVAGEPSCAQLLALRAASAGTPVHIVTGRPEFWEPVVRHGPGSRLVPPGESTPAPAGPSLLVDDRPGQGRAVRDVRPWQCRIEVRADWGAAELGSFAHADVTVFGAVSAEVSLRIASLYGIAARRTEPMTGLDPRTVALVRRARVEYVSLVLSPAEQHALERAGRQLTASRIAP